MFSPQDQAPIFDIAANSNFEKVSDPERPVTESTPTTQASAQGTAASPVTPQPQPTVPPQPSPAKLLLTPSEVTTSPGQTVELTLKGEAVPETQHMQVTISYNPDLLEFTDALPGQFFRINQKNSSMTVSASPQTGKIVLQFGRAGYSESGSGQLATLVFKTKAKGQSSLVIKQPKLTGPTGQSVPITVQHSLIRIL